MDDPTPSLTCDLLVIGGGINGTGIARDAAGRGLRVVLCEKDDLASHTSSASTKLIHGGLRYLEHLELGLVRKSLAERELLLRAAPHLVTPLRFAMPHEAHARPAWMIRAGLFLYDHLARRKILPGSTMVRLAGTPLGAPLKDRFRRAFLYSDAWADDARLVVANALDAADRGARILTRTRCTGARPHDGGWRATLRPERGGEVEVTARALVNAAGPFAAEVVRHVLGREAAPTLRLVKGSHVVVRRLFDHHTAYLFQNPDRRITFAIPYEEDFTLIGTTDVEHRGAPDRVAIAPEEVDYLCAATNRYFRREIGPADVVWSYSGVRPLLDDAEIANPSALTRDYRLDLELAPAPLLNVWGGKLTTYRRLAEEVLERLRPVVGASARPWTAHAPLPGGDLVEPGRLVPTYDFAAFLARFGARWPWVPAALARRWARAYGTRAEAFLSGARRLEDLGDRLLDGLYEAEARHLVEREWARSAEDILWRRTKLGLRASPADVARLEAWLAGSRPGAARAAPRPPAAGGVRARLELRGVSKTVGVEPYLHPMSLSLAAGHINVLLGATRAGKTTLLRLIAGLDRPSAGRILAEGVDVTATSARDRNVAMVFQQFINYPAMTVFENIASPLRLERRPAPEIRARVGEIAGKLHIEHLLDRLPRELSGGQQQRTALARALAKRASLVLLDEPLVNLDYKLREELRAELVGLFAEGETTVVYATTEPLEALLLGGYTAVLDRGRLLQFGRTLDVYRNPASVEVAAAFNDPPMNVVDATVVEGGAIRLADGATLPLPRRVAGLEVGARCRAGIRPYQVRLRWSDPGAVELPGEVELPGTVELAELSGSETLLHLRHASVSLLAQLQGVHAFQLGAPVTAVVDPRELFLFDVQGALLLAPAEARDGQD
jgi:glycerol-3-phosphate dehydrogenase